MVGGRARALPALLVLGLSACGGGNAAAPSTDAAFTADGSGVEASVSQGADASNAQGVDSGSNAGVGDGSSAGTAADGGDAGLWRPFDDTSPWNTPIAADASIDPDSGSLVSDLASIPGQTTLWINIQQYSVPVYWVDSTTTAEQTVSASLGGTGFRTGAASDSVSAGTGLAPIPSGAMPAAGTDKHLCIVDRTAHTEWGFWDADDSTGSWTAGEASTMDLSGSGVRPPTAMSPWWAGQGPRACGYPLIAGLITTGDIQAGTIRHALVFAYPHIESRYYVPPASSAQGTTSEALPTRGIPCGGHLQLDPSLNVTSLGLSSGGLMIARALQTYGAFVGDFSGAVNFYADASPTAQAFWSTGTLANSDAAPIPLDRFRVLTIGMPYDNMN